MDTENIGSGEIQEESKRRIYKWGEMNLGELKTKVEKTLKGIST